MKTSNNYPNYGMSANKWKFYEVAAKCGHGNQGRYGEGYYVRVNFAVAAIDGKKAAESIRWKSRVKHHDSRAILSVKEINFGDYISLRKENLENPFLKAHSSQEQKILIESDVMEGLIVWEDEGEYPNKKDSDNDRPPTFLKNTRIKNKRKFFAKYRDEFYCDRDSMR